MMAVRKKPLKKERGGSAAKPSRRRGRPANKLDVDRPLPEVFNKEVFGFDPKDGWEKMDREEIIVHLKDKYDKTMADIIADCFDEDPDMRPEVIMAMFKQKCNLDVDRQYIYTGKNRWKSMRMAEDLRQGMAVSNGGALLPDIIRLIKTHGIDRVKEAIQNFEVIAQLMK